MWETRVWSVLTSTASLAVVFNPIDGGWSILNWRLRWLLCPLPITMYLSGE